MARRPGELSVRPLLVSPRRPRTPGQAEAAEREGRELRPLSGSGFPIPPEQEEALLQRFEVWKAKWNGSLPEFIVWEFLTIDKKQIPDVDFLFQHGIFGGRTRFGGYILDYFLERRLEGWRVMGERFHLEQPEDRARDFIMKTQLMSQGIKVIDLWETDLLTRRDFVLSLAWERSASVKSRAPFGSTGG
ncbi:hypothetical protein LCGC14_0295140 [marine sediment metagenome]|uniref:DUF559 domain-containing protein n=1 Tax=marine sediment metagenome TaxID=412755 RepID=A0A0F9WDF5_9ZZZZ